MRGNIIEEPYYGNLDPQACSCRPKSPVKKAFVTLNNLEKKLTKRLNGEDKELFLHRSLPCSILRARRGIPTAASSQAK